VQRATQPWGAIQAGNGTSHAHSQSPSSSRHPIVCRVFSGCSRLLQRACVRSLLYMQSLAALLLRETRVASNAATSTAVLMRGSRSGTQTNTQGQSRMLSTGGRREEGQGREWDRGRNAGESTSQAKRAEITKEVQDQNGTHSHKDQHACIGHTRSLLCVVMPHVWNDD